MTDEQIYELAFKHCYATTAAAGFIFDRERGHMLAFARALLASKDAVPEDIKITCEHDDRIELVEIVDAKRIDGTLHIAIRIDAAAPAQPLTAKQRYDELTDDARDAARYWWVREYCDIDYRGNLPEGFNDSGDAIDAAIAAALAQPCGEDAAKDAQPAGVALATKVWQDTAHLRGEAPGPNAAPLADIGEDANGATGDQAGWCYPTGGRTRFADMGDTVSSEFAKVMRPVYYARAALPAEKVAAPKLAVWYGSMPESNGKTNWTAILHKGDVWRGITLDRSEYPDRVRYEADRVRWLIGELDKEPWILDYDADKHSGYTAEKVAQAEPDIKALVNRFLAWPLPQTVAADGCATNSAYAFPRSGTHLLNADEAEAMLRHVLAAPQPAKPDNGDKR